MKKNPEMEKKLTNEETPQMKKFLLKKKPQMKKKLYIINIE